MAEIILTKDDMLILKAGYAVEKDRGIEKSPIIIRTEESPYQIRKRAMAAKE